MQHLVLVSPYSRSRLEFWSTRVADYDNQTIPCNSQTFLA